MIAEHIDRHTPPDSFPFVDTAIGGANRRNNVRRIEDFRPPPDGVDCYATYLHYTDALLDHVAVTRNEKGQPSVRGYAGPALAPFLPADFDDEEDLAAALADARTYVRRLGDRYDVPPTAIRPYFSGNKGFSVEVPGTLFGGFEPGPAPHVARRLRAVAQALAEGLPTLDPKIYEPLRLWRRPNTVNGKSGRRKIPLSAHELLTLDLEAILCLADAPREIEHAPDDEWEARPDLVVLWQQTASSPRRSAAAGPVAEGTKRLTEAQADALIALVGRSWTKGHKHDLGLCLAGFLAKSGVGEDQALGIVERLAADDKDPGDRIDGVRSTYDRARANLDVLGHRGLRALLDPLDLRTLETLVAGAERVRPAEAAGRTDATDEAPPNRPPTDVPTEPTGETHHLSDLGNAKRLVAQHGDDLRYCPAWGKWLAWNGRRWERDDTGEVYRRAKQTVHAIYREAADAGDDESKALAKHALRSEGEARIRAMVSLAESEPGVPVLPAQLDRNPWLFNTVNGTIDLRTGSLRAHDRADLITRSSGFAYDELAACPTWISFLDRVLSGKRDTIAFLQRAVGYSLTGQTGERLLFILWGMGRNGKSTLLETILGLLGGDDDGYADSTTTDTLLATRDGAIPNDVAKLKGKRFVFASEAEEGRRMAEAKVKSLTGGDTVSARFMRGEWFSFRPEFKLWLGTNHKPNIKGTDHAIWDRVRLIPFNVRIPDDEQDPNLRDKLLVEAPGILAWAVEGCLAWQRDGLKPPEAVRSATESYRAEMDVLGHFLEECCLLEPSARATAKELYSAYQTWCGEAGEKPITQKAFGQRFAERGLDSVQLGKSRARYWVGVGLVDHHGSGGRANTSGGVNA